MQLPLQVQFRDMDASEALEADIREKAQKLDEVYDRITSCRVVVEARHRHHNKGNIYHVRVDVTVPGDEIVVSREPHDDHSHEDPYVSVRDAFQAARRQLESFARRQRRHVKTHAVPAHGRIASLFPEEGFGRIETPDGREIYFHRNSLLGADLDQLQVGSEVRYAEEQGDNGPQASSVSLVGKHHPVG